MAKRLRYHPSWFNVPFKTTTADAPNLVDGSPGNTSTGYTAATAAWDLGAILPISRIQVTYLGDASDPDVYGTVGYSDPADPNRDDGIIYQVGTWSGEAGGVTRTKDYPGLSVNARFVYFALGGRPQPEILDFRVWDGAGNLYTLDPNNVFPVPASSAAASALPPTVKTGTQALVGVSTSTATAQAHQPTILLGNFPPLPIVHVPTASGATLVPSVVIGELQGTGWTRFESFSGTGWSNPTSAYYANSSYATSSVFIGTNPRLHCTGLERPMQTNAQRLEKIRIRVKVYNDTYPTLYWPEINLIRGGVVMTAISKGGFSDPLIGTSGYAERTFEFSAEELKTLGIRTSDQINRSDFGVALMPRLSSGGGPIISIDEVVIDVICLPSTGYREIVQHIPFQAGRNESWGGRLGSTLAWTSPQNAVSLDTAEASIQAPSPIPIPSNSYGLAIDTPFEGIPPGASILGFRVRAIGRSFANRTLGEVILQRPASGVSDDLPNTIAVDNSGLPDSKGRWSWGTLTELVGETWASTHVNDYRFGVTYVLGTNYSGLNPGGPNIWVDYGWVEIRYSLGDSLQKIRRRYPFGSA